MNPKTALVILSVVAAFVVAEGVQYMVHVTTGPQQFPPRVGSLFVIVQGGANTYNISISTRVYNLRPNSMYSSPVNSPILAPALSGSKFQWIDRTGGASAPIYLKNVTMIPTYIQDPNMRKTFTRVFCAQAAPIRTMAVTPLTRC